MGSEGFRATGGEHEKKEEAIPPIGEGIIRIIPLGGVEEVGQNMTAIEYGNDIIVVDCGFQFREEETPGIDFILPNTRYLEDRKDKIRGVFITHGHLDHIGAIPYIMPLIGNPPIYTRQFGAIMIGKRQEEFAQLAALNIKVIDGDETIAVSENIKVTTFPISHTIPDSMGLVIKTPLGNIVFIEDVRVDNIDGVPTEEEIEQYKRFKNMDILMLTMDSTSIEKAGFSLSEQVVIKNIERIIRGTSSRLIIATFASQVERIIAILNICRALNKKVVFEGRSMKTNLEIMKQLKLVDVESLVIPIEDIENYPPDRVVMISTGAQGEEFSALMRIANKTHKFLRLKPTDTILLSSSIIPSNFNAVVKLKDNLYRSEAKIITYLDADVHASGHGNRDELRWIHQQIPYRFFMPVHGHHYMLRQHAEMAYTVGTPKENVIVPDNGSIVEIYDEGKKIRKLTIKAPSYPIMVDGFSVGGVQEVVMRDRKMLAQDGFVVIVASVNGKTGKLRKSPDIISRGFVYLRESQELLQHTRMLIKRTIEQTTADMNPINFDFVKSNVNEAVERYLFQKTAKRPIVIPVVLGV
jgi:ribonuclease J